MLNKKPVLIIPCSGAKKDSACSAFDMYEGELFKLIRANLEFPTEVFEIFILSAELGLVHADTVIEPYDKKMHSRKYQADIDAYADRHRCAFNKALKPFADDGRDIYICLFNDYLAAFQSILQRGAKTEEDKRKRRNEFFNKFAYHYMSEKPIGIGDLKGRLKRCLFAATNNTFKEPVWFRSGIANRSELGYLAAGQDLGTTLARVNTSKSTDLLAALIEGTKNVKLFIDNGLITLVNKGHEIDDMWVFDEYEKIINALPRKQLKNISIVVPDDPFNPQNAIDIVRRHKTRILKWSHLMEVIVPIHQCDDIRKQGLDTWAVLGYSPKVRLGIPCLKNSKIDFELPLADINALLALKNPKKKNAPLFNKVHFFAMSEYTDSNKLKSRLAMAKLYDLDVSLDCARTAALFGHKSSKRYGSVVAAELTDAHIEKHMPSSKQYQAYSYQDEFYQADHSPLVSDELYDLLMDKLNSEAVIEFYGLYNALLADQPMLQMPMPDEDDCEEAVEVMWQMLGHRAVREALFEAQKRINPLAFRYWADDLVKFESEECRFRAIQETSLTPKSSRSGIVVEGEKIPVQLPLLLDSRAA